MNKNDLLAAKSAICAQLLQLGLGGQVIGKRATFSVASAVASASRNVHAVGIGKKVSTNKKSSEDCVRIYVVQKLPRSLMSPRDVIPESINGIPTDIIEAEPAFAFAKKKPSKAKKPAKPKKKPAALAHATDVAGTTSGTQAPQRPVIGGISAGHRDITAGTLGCFCHSTNPGDDPDQLFALSNNHIFANVNQAILGDPLYQPGPGDGGGFNDYFANLQRYIPISLGGLVSNRVDAAIGSPLSSVPVNPVIDQIGTISGTLTVKEGMKIRKQGRRTGYTEGVVDDADMTVFVGMDRNDTSAVAKFENQFRIVSEDSRPIGLGGDSGSLIVHRTQDKAVGLYFAGPDSGEYGVANPIDFVLQDLEISIP
ncbi:MAG: hypothetical protein KDA77_17320 [Planctomycetaceae bacterium]|nr:hypothetical protein [Planctomycetaceae bacterium]